MEPRAKRWPAGVRHSNHAKAVHLLRIEDWKEVSETAQNFLTNVFSGLLNTKLVEDANKFQREQEDRGNNSKSVPMTEAWQTVSKHEVLKAYKRPEAQASTQYLVPAKWNIEQVCRTNVRRTDAKTPEQEADFEFLRRVTGNQTWPAFTPETEQRLFCNHALLVHVRQLGNKWDLVEKAWISGLVQSGTLLKWQGQAHFVLRAYEQGLLLWPMQDTGDSRLAFQKPLDKLVWGFLFDVESCKVATVTPTPPMIGLRSQRAGVQVVAGAWEPLLKNVLDRGCAGLSESQLKKLNGLLGNDEPEANQQDQEIALAVHILINQDPSLSEQEVLNRIHIKTADEELPVEGMTEEMAQVLRVTIRPEDQQKIMKTLSEKNKPPPVKVAELAKKCYQQSYKKIPAKKVQEAVKRKKKEEGNSPDAMITAKDCPLQFRASDYFPKLPATGNRWTYHVDADALAILRPQNFQI